MKTDQEINNLKMNWINDPCWDIEDTEGFEDYHDELLAFRTEQEAKWEQERQARLEVRAAENNLAPADMEIIETYELRANDYSENAKQLLLHYFDMNNEFNADCRYEIESIVSHIISAAVNQSIALMIKRTKKLPNA